MELREFGPAAWLLDDVDDPAVLSREISQRRLQGVIEIVPAESTVLVQCERRHSADVGSELASFDRHLRESPITHTIDALTIDALTIDVVYDGEDLAEVAERIGLGIDEVIDLHLAGEYTVAFCGFSPGFGYLTGLDPALHVERRTTPRTRVPGGAVAIAAGYCAVYPSPSPGGWNLIASTTAVLWDELADSPAAMMPGRRVRFRRIDP